MDRKTLPSSAVRLNTGMLLVAALILIGIVGFSYREWTQYRRASADAARTREISDSVAPLVSSVIDAETGQRGFVLTGEARYLEPYNQAILAIPTEEANLRKLLTQPQEQSGLAQLSNLVDQNWRSFVKRSSFEELRASNLP
jgi:CHASE3 domain sensor protein